MDQYITGAIIRRLREEKGMTQSALAERLCVSDKTVSKWETGKGYPDISLLQSLAAALDISVVELLSGADISNRNRSGNLLRSQFYVCPVCGNILTGLGNALISCHGVTLPPLEAEEADEAHALCIEPVEDEYYITVNHPMTKEHYISFIAGVSDHSVQLVKLYPEANAEVRLKRDRLQKILFYCNRDGLFCSILKKLPYRA